MKLSTKSAQRGSISDISVMHVQTKLLTKEKIQPLQKQANW